MTFGDSGERSFEQRRTRSYQLRDLDAVEVVLPDEVKSFFEV
jgi:hypothetical protein